MTHLESVTRDNIDELIGLSVREDQQSFVSSVADSLAQAYVYSDDAYPFGIYEDDTLVGFIMMGYYEVKNYYTLWKFLIDQRYQNQGYGRQALELGLAYVKDRFNPPDIYIGVAPGNMVAKKLYESVGFEATGLIECGMEEMRFRYRRNNHMSNIEKYKKYFTKDYLMGPNSFRLLDELIRRCPEDVKFDRTLDLGCGFALTSLFIANETEAKHVYAFDLWVPATENYKRIMDNRLVDKIIPIHGDAMDMPFAEDYFDSVVSVDSYHYFGCKEGVFVEKILPFVKENGYVMIAIPGLKERPQGEIKQLFETWAEGDDSELFKTAKWWEELLNKECGDCCRIEVKEAECYDIAWQEWFESGHEYGVRDKEFLDKGLYDILNFLLIYVRKGKG